MRAPTAAASQLQLAKSAASSAYSTSAVWQEISAKALDAGSRNALGAASRAEKARAALEVMMKREAAAVGFICGKHLPKHTLQLIEVALCQGVNTAHA